MKFRSNDVTGYLRPGPGNPRNSEGAFLALRDGRLLYAYSRYHGDRWDDNAACDICGIFSRDGGVSWDTEHIRTLVRAAEYGETNVMSVSLIRFQNGDAGLFFILKHDGRWSEYLLRRTADEFVSFSEEVRCIDDTFTGYYVVNNDRVLACPDGTLYIPAAQHLSTIRGEKNVFDGRGTVYVWRSTDDGHSFSRLPGVLYPGAEALGQRGLQEPGLLRLPGDVLYAYMRTDLLCQYESVSIDGGESWFAPRPSRFASPVSPMLIRRDPFRGRYYAVWNPIPNYPGRDVPGFGWDRTPLVMADSADGIHFSPFTVLEDDPSRGFCYPSLYFPDAHTLLLAYCSGGREDGIFLNRVTLRRITIE